MTIEYFFKDTDYDVKVSEKAKRDFVVLLCQNSCAFSTRRNHS